MHILCTSCVSYLNVYALVLCLYPPPPTLLRDLWAPVSKSNEYGGRANKNIKTGKLTERSYVPSGLTKAQYEKIRSDADKKKAANYERNVKKAFKFQDYTDFYMKRGSDENGSWMKLPNRGHDMAKTKYDWSMTGSESRQLIEDNGNGKR